MRSLELSTARAARRGPAAFAATRAVSMVTLAAFLAPWAASAIAQTPVLERGRYLVTAIMACGNCHTPKDADGRPVPGKELAGGADLDAVVVYLRSVPAVRNATPLSTYRAPVMRETFPEAERSITERDLTDKVRRGAYLATIAHCIERHAPMQRGALQFETALGAGGRPFLPSFVKGLLEAWKGAVSRNVTPHPEQGRGKLE